MFNCQDWNLCVLFLASAGIYSGSKVLFDVSNL